MSCRIWASYCPRTRPTVTASDSAARAADAAEMARLASSYVVRQDDRKAREGHLLTSNKMQSNKTQSNKQQKQIKTWTVASSASRSATWSTRRSQSDCHSALSASIARSTSRASDALSTAPDCAVREWVGREWVVLVEGNLHKGQNRKKKGIANLGVDLGETGGGGVKAALKRGDRLDTRLQRRVLRLEPRLKRRDVGLQRRHYGGGVGWVGR